MRNKLKQAVKEIEKWKGEAYQSGDDIDHALEGQPGRNAHRNEPAQGILAPGCHLQELPNEERQHDNKGNRAQKPQLLTDDGKDKVAMPHREKMQLALRPLPKTLAQPTARTNRILKVSLSASFQLIC